MPELLHPGVYVQEVPSAVRPIEGVSTATAAFLGVTDKGPLPGRKLPNGRMAQPVMVTSFTDYLRQFGGYRQDSFLTYAVQAFFDNGGHRLYIVRVAGSGAGAAIAGASTLFTFTAVLPGAWGNNLKITAAPSSGAGDSFDLTVSVHGNIAGQNFIEVEPFSSLTVNNAQNEINSKSKFVRVAVTSTKREHPTTNPEIPLEDGADATPAQPAHANTGGSNGIEVTAKYPGTWANGNLKISVTNPSDSNNDKAIFFDLVVKLGDKPIEQFPNVTSSADTTNYARTKVNADTDGSKYITLPNDFNERPDNTANDVTLDGGSDDTGGTASTATATWERGSTSATLPISVANEGEWGNEITVVISDSSDGTADNFSLTVNDGKDTVESIDNIPYNQARTLINSRSEYIVITEDLTSRPTNTPKDTPIPLTGGSDGGEPTSDDYKSSLHALDKITDVNLIAIPGQGDADIVNAGLDYCYNRLLLDCFFIGEVGTIRATEARRNDAVLSVSTVENAKNFARTSITSKTQGQYGAIYYPWIWAADHIGIGRNPRILLPPSGFVAGIYSRIDNSRGVFKAPAGSEAGVSGALAPATIVSDTEQDLLNPSNVNVIRTVPGSGIVVWGARTIGSDAGWRYIPVRRMAIFLRVSIYYGIQWAVFEPNDEPLWSSLRLNIRSFMLNQFRAGAFQGSKPDDAFFVKCDSSTTTQQDIDSGVVNILVGFAPLKPAEFVVLKLSQKVNQPAM